MAECEHDNLYSVLISFLSELKCFGSEIGFHANQAIYRAQLAGETITSVMFGTWILKRQALIAQHNEVLFCETHTGPLADLLNTMNNLWASLSLPQNKATIWSYLEYFVELSSCNK